MIFLRCKNKPKRAGRSPNPGHFPRFVQCHHLSSVWVSIGGEAVLSLHRVHRGDIERRDLFGVRFIYRFFIYFLSIVSRVLCGVCAGHHALTTNAAKYFCGGGNFFFRFSLRFRFCLLFVHVRYVLPKTGTHT